MSDVMLSDGERSKVICGDCLEIMRKIPNGYAHLCLTDPPYGIRINRVANKFGDATHTSRRATDIAWDDNVPTPEYFTEMMRVSQQQIVFGANYFWNVFRNTSCYIVWDKRGNLPSVPFSPTEFAWTSYDRQPKRYTVINHGFIRDSKDERTEHPTQKPTELMVRILLDFTQPDDIVLDPFCGSGSTGVACLRTGRRFIGIEISPHYTELTRARLSLEESIPMLNGMELVT